MGALLQQFACQAGGPDRQASLRLFQAWQQAPWMASSSQGVSSDGGPMASLAKKVPLPKKTGVAALDARAHINRDALVWVVDRLSKNLHEAPRIQGYMLSAAFAQVGSTDSVTEAWTGNYKVLESLPKTFMVKYLLQRAADLKIGVLTGDVLKQLEIHSTLNIPQLFSMDLQLPLSLAMPSEMQNEAVCMRVCKARGQGCGDRLSLFANAGGFLTAGSLNWKTAGCYSFEWEGDNVCTIKHITGVYVPVPSHAPIDKSFVVKDNDGDWKALVEHLPSQHSLSKFFTDAEFLQYMYQPGKNISVLRSLCKDVIETMEKERASGEASTEAAAAAISSLKEAGHVKKADSLKRARQKLIESQQKRKELRAIAL